MAALGGIGGDGTAPPDLHLLDGVVLSAGRAAADPLDELRSAVAANKDVGGILGRLAHGQSLGGGGLARVEAEGVRRRGDKVGGGRGREVVVVIIIIVIVVIIVIIVFGMKQTARGNRVLPVPHNMRMRWVEGRRRTQQQGPNKEGKG